MEHKVSLTPVEVENTNGEKLCLHKVEEDNFDSLLNEEGKYTLLVNDPFRYFNLKKYLGDKPRVYFDSDRQNTFQVFLDRNYPHLYAKKDFLTRGRKRYSISSDLRIFGRKSIEGRRISRIAGLPYDYYWLFANILNLGEETDEVEIRGRIKQAEDLLISVGIRLSQKKLTEYSNAERPFLALTLQEDDAVICKRIGLVTSPLEEIL